jgi:hypothetical protein
VAAEGREETAVLVAVEEHREEAGLAEVVPEEAVAEGGNQKSFFVSDFMREELCKSKNFIAVSELL